jgi:acetylglutamate kinase
MNGALTIKLGGTAGRQLDVLHLIASQASRDCVIVHGGGHEIGTWSRRLGLEPLFHDGLRVTDDETLEVVVAVLAGLVNARLVAHLADVGRPAAGLTGAAGGLLELRPADPALGRVAEVVGVETGPLDTLLKGGLTPVVAPIGAIAGRLYNVNADAVAGAIAAARGGRLVLCTDVPAVLRGGHPVSELDLDGAQEMLDSGEADAGMRPKLQAAMAAAVAGCEVLIIDGQSTAQVEAALIGQSVGTAIVAPGVGAVREVS